MDKISINNLYKFEDNQYKNNVIDVNSLFNFKENQTTQSVNFDLEKLIKLKEKKKNKILIQYEKIFKLCLDKITLANNLNKTEVVYEIPDAIFGYFDYNKLDCMQYINSKLKNMNLDTLLLNDMNIYISWLNLETNIIFGTQKLL